MRPVYDLDTAVSYLASVAITHNDGSGPSAQNLKDVRNRKAEVWISRIPDKSGWHKVFLCPYGFERPTNPVLVGMCARLTKFKGRSIPKSEAKVRTEAKNKGITQKKVRADKRAKHNGTAKLDAVRAETIRRNKLDKYLGRNQTVIRSK
jgi:hypothetical protein